LQLTEGHVNADAAFMIAQQQALTKEEMKAKRAALFAEIDTDGDGKIDIKEAVAYGMSRVRGFYLQSS
jgi:hypothetical protein